MIENCLRITSLEDNSIVSINKEGSPATPVSLEYRTDSNQTWQTYTIGTQVTLADGSWIEFRNTTGTFNDDAENYQYFEIIGRAKVSGNTNSLLDWRDETTPLDYGCFEMLFFGCDGLVDASELLLPSMTLAGECYTDMFDSCTSLTAAPALPATNLDYACYASMFYGCTSLVEAPELPATNLKETDEFCYAGMFYGCSSLNQIVFGGQKFIQTFYWGSSVFTEEWLVDASPTGTFYYTNPNLDISTIPRTTSGVPSGWEIKAGRPPVPILNPLRLTSLENNNVLTLAMKGTPHAVSLEYRTNSNETWQTYTPGTQLTLANGSWAEFRNTTGLLSKGTNDRYYFTMTKTMAASGNTNSLLDWRDNTCPITQSCFHMLFVDTKLTACPELPATTLANSCYWGMFRGIKTLTTNLPELPATNLAQACYSTMFYDSTNVAVCPELPATQMADWCYDQMFQGCSITTPPSLPSTNLALRCYNGMFLNCKKLTQAPALPATTLYQYCYSQMFNNCTSLTQAPELPATTLAQYCYSQMFMGCTSLTQAPNLPATTLANYCYNSMFNGCKSLTQAPNLPATTLANYCYTNMFNGCTALIQAPALPATTLAIWCYNYMFRNCTSLTQAPELPATTLVTNCYNSMFYGCTSLAQAPALPATTLASSCYSYMFYMCRALTSAPELPATTLASSCYNSMFMSCPNIAEVIYGAPIFVSSNSANWLYMGSSTGTFYYTNPNLEISTIPRTTSGVPEGWQIKYGRPSSKMTFQIGGKTVNTLYLNGKAVKTLFVDGKKIYG